MPESPQNARTHTHARRWRWRFAVSYTVGKESYSIIIFEGLWPSIRFWWRIRRHPNFQNVKWEIL